MKKAIGILVCLLILFAASALAEEPAVVATNSGITVVKADEWAETYPDQYATYSMNKDNEELHDYVEEYPFIATVYEGMAFNTYYGSARGHYYTIQDVTNTGRPHKLANCFTCKTPDFTNKVNNEGVSAYSIPFEDMLAQINESISCYNCHANTPGPITVTHTYLSDAMGADLANVAPGNAACGQCHVEYYFSPETKEATLPYTSLSTMNPDSIYAYYEEMGFSDYTNPRTGVQQIKVQHPEYETFTGAGSVHGSTFTCADCHMGTETNDKGETYTSHYWVSPLKSESIMATCSGCHTDLVGFVTEIQTAAEERTIAIGEKLEALTNKLAEAVESNTYTEDELNQIRALNRKGQFYWDFVFVENSEGAHNRQLTTSCLDTAESLIDEAMGLFKQ